MFPSVGEQLEHADEHGVVAQLVLVRDLFAQGNHLIPIATGKVIGSPVSGICLPHLGLSIGCHFGGTVDGLHVDVFGAGHLGAGKIEQRQLEADLVALLQRQARIRLGSVAKFEHIDEAGCLREAERCGEAFDLLARGLQIQPVAQRASFKISAVG